MDEGSSDTNQIQRLSCYNCDNTVSLSDKFCPHCGQANHPTRLTAGILIKDFINNFFDLDSRFFKTLFHIYSPSFLTKEYVAGKRVKYANPIRLFVLSLFLLFGVLMLYLDDVIHFDLMDDPQEQLYSDKAQAELFDKFNEYTDSTFKTEIEQTLADSIRVNVFKKIKSLDSTYVPFSGMNITYGGEQKDYNFLAKDVLELEPDSVLVKYNITEFSEKIFVKQFLKAYVSGGRTLQFLISNGLWAIVLSIVISAFILKLLHIRHRIFYIEHVILLFNAHSFLFILLTIAIGLALLDITSYHPIIYIISSYWLYIIIIFKKYYKQGIIKTFIKFIIYMMTYSFIFIMCAIFVAILSFLLF